MDGEWLLDHLPQCLYIYFPGATWTVHEDLGVGVYPLSPVSRTWTVNEYTGIKARRTGFFIVPDFASTAHMIQGASLDAVLSSCPGPSEKTSTTDQIAAYVSLSRAKRADKVYAIEPFSPWLFQHGTPKGPNLLMRKLRGQITSEQALARWSGEDDSSSANSDVDEAGDRTIDPMRKEYHCMQCALQGRESMKKLADFGIDDPTQLYSELIMDGMWTRCLTCRQSQGTTGDTDEARKRARDEAERLQEGASKLQCTVCKKLKLLAAFYESSVKHQARAHHRCRACHKCIKCSEERKLLEFEPDAPTCKKCSQEEMQGENSVKCDVCTRQKDKSDFHLSVFKHKTVVKRCTACCRCKQCGEERNLRHFTGNAPHCTTCKETKCGVCGIIYPASSFTQTNRDSHEKHETTLVCATCIGHGCTPRCTRKVRCAECKTELGITMFYPTEWNNYHKLKDTGKQNTSTITCKGCQDTWKARLKDLKTRITKSSVRCTCRKPIHQETCRLFNPYNKPQNPWRGQGVTAEDIAFLDKQRPNWWLKCLGKV